MQITSHNWIGCLLWANRLPASRFQSIPFSLFFPPWFFRLTLLSWGGRGKDPGSPSLWGGQRSVKGRWLFVMPWSCFRVRSWSLPQYPWPRFQSAWQCFQGTGSAPGLSFRSTLKWSKPLKLSYSLYFQAFSVAQNVTWKKCLIFRGRLSAFPNAPGWFPGKNGKCWWVGNPFSRLIQKTARRRPVFAFH